MKKFLLSTLLGCSGLFAAETESTSNQEQTQVYVGSRSKGIYSTWLNTNTGSLSQPELMIKANGADFITIHPNHKFLYSCAKSEQKAGAVAGYSISTDGSLTEIGKQEIQGKSLCHISLDKNSRILMGANYGDGSIVSLPINTDGSIAKLASIHKHEGSSTHPRRQTKPHAHSIYRGPSNKYAYAPDLGIDKVMIYTIDHETAKLTPKGFAKTPAGAGPRHMKFSKDGKQAYVLNELTVDISVFNLNAETGNLTITETVSTLEAGIDKSGITCSEIRVSKDGQFVYCANRDVAGKGRDSLSVFSVNDGKIKLIQNIGAAVHIPRNINIDPSGNWLLVAGQKSNNISVFKIDNSTGKLSATTHTTDLPAAMCIEFRR